jgi:hypothetical protein
MRKREAVGDVPHVVALNVDRALQQPDDMNQWPIF